MITILLAMVAYVSMNFLGNVVSLLGSLVGIPIALIYPPLMHNVLNQKTRMSRLVGTYPTACAQDHATKMNNIMTCGGYHTLQDFFLP